MSFSLSGSTITQAWTYTKTLNYIEFDSAPLWNGTTPTILKEGL